MPFPEVKRIDKMLALIDKIIEKYIPYGMGFGIGFCTECHKLTWNLHDSSSQGFHCKSCCKEENRNEQRRYC